MPIYMQIEGVVGRAEPLTPATPAAVIASALRLVALVPAPPPIIQK